MSGNNDQNADREPQEISAQEAVMNTLRAIAAERFSAQSVRAFLVEGLAFLKEKSEGRFDFEPLSTGGPVVLATNVEMQDPPEKLRLSLYKDQVNINLRDADKEPTAFIPSDEDVHDAADYADEWNREAGDNFSDAEWSERYDERMEQIRQEAEADDEVLVATRISAAAALTAVAKEALLHGYIFCNPDQIEADTPAQEAIVAGLRDATRERDKRLTMAFGAARPFIDGLEFLEKLSQGAIEVKHVMWLGQSAVEIKVAAAGEELFATQFLRIDTNGRVSFGTDNQNYPSRRYDALDAEDIGNILTAITRTAVLANLTPYGAGEGIAAASPEQELVLRTLHRIEEEREMAHRGADYLAGGLAALTARFPRQIYFEINECSENTNVEIVVNKGRPSMLVLSVNKDGVFETGGETYDASEPAQLNEALDKITRQLLDYMPNIDLPDLRDNPPPKSNRGRPQPKQP